MHSRSLPSSGRRCLVQGPTGVWLPHFSPGWWGCFPRGSAGREGQALANPGARVCQRQRREPAELVEQSLMGKETRDREMTSLLLRALRPGS